MFTFIRNYINRIAKQSDAVDYPMIQHQLKMYDLSKAERILVVVSLDVGNLPKSKAVQHCAEFKEQLYLSLFSNEELYSIFIIPVKGSNPTTIELYSVPK